MIKKVLRRGISIVITILMLAAIMPSLSIPAWAESVTTGVTGLTADSSGSATWTSSNGAISGSVKAKSSSSCTGTTYSSQTGSLTYTNNSGDTALLSFDYETAINSGSISINGSAITDSSGSFSKKLIGSETLEVTLTSNSSNANPTTIEMTNIKLTPEQNVSISFMVATNGSYTVNGNPISTNTQETFLTTDSVVLIASANNDYKFLGWRNVTQNRYISTNSSFTTSFTENATIVPIFVSSTDPVFDVSGELFTDLNDAKDYAVRNNKSSIVLISNGVLPGDSYEIPSGKTLLIPFSTDGASDFSTVPAYHTNSYSAPSDYRILTLSPGAHLTIKGKLVVSGSLAAKGQTNGNNGSPSGPHGRINMAVDSSIDVENGGVLACWGYISADNTTVLANLNNSGTPSVTVKSGGILREAFNIRDWPGGSNATSTSAFPMNQYYIQNVEVPLRIDSGATEYVTSCVYASSALQKLENLAFIGNGGMFTLGNGYLTRKYDASVDRILYDMYGTVSINNMTIKFGSISLPSTSYVLPINGNMTIAIHTGTASLNQRQNFELLPGVEVKLDESVTLNVPDKLYVYDADNWETGFAYTGVKIRQVNYVAVRKGAPVTRSSTVDASIDVNGSMNVSGSLYTSLGGANITSSNQAGTITFSAKPPTNDTTIVQNAGSATDVTMNPARLHNGANTNQYVGTDEEYTATAGKAANTTFSYCSTCDKWYTGTHSHDFFTASFNANNGSGSISPITTNTSSEVTLPDGIGFTRTGYHFVGWCLNADCTGTTYNAGDTVTLEDDTVFYAKWEINTYTVTWKNGDTIIETDENVPYGTTPSYDGEEPTKAGNAQYSYSFAGWSPTVTAVTGDVTYTATFTQSTNTYTVTWKNEDGTVLETDANVEYGATPTYDGEEPTKAGDAQYSYTFAGWNPEVSEVTDDVTYTATFTQSTNTYTVTWKNEDGTVLETDANVEYGATPEYNSATPEKNGDAQYSYTFAGWTPEVVAVTGDVTYTATFTQSTNTYTVTWKNEDGTVLETDENVPYGTTPTYNGATPTKAGTAQYTYAFSGWTPEVSAVQGNVTYTATFNETVNTYTVTWKNADGTVLETDANVPYGTTPSYDGETPTKESTDEFEFSFVGWDPEITLVTGDKTYTAKFLGTIRSYTITWLNDDDSLIDTTTVKYGITPTHADASKQADAQYTYTFKAWTPTIVSVSGPATYKATYNTTVNTYTVTWKNYDGTVLETDTEVPYGTTPSYDGETPAKPGDAQYTHAFVGWHTEQDSPTALGSLPTVSGNVTYYAVFDGIVNKYTVTWKNWDGTILETDENVQYGTTPEYNGVNPEKESSVQYNYAFAGWDPAIAKVTGNVTYTATYTETLRAYTVIWKNHDGSVLETDEDVPYGTMPSYDGETPEKEATAQYSYTFAGWEPEIEEVTGNVEYTAQFTETVNTYTVTWKNEDGTVLETDENVPYGTMPGYDGKEPTKAPDDEYTYTFAEWDPEIERVTGDTTYTATYTRAKRSYTITWRNWDGSEIGTTTVEYGETPVYTGVEPTRIGDAQYSYAFSGWSPAIQPVSGDATYTATFTESINQYTITWVDEDGITVLETDEKVSYGMTPTYDGETPTKAATAQYTYTFAGWDPEITSETIVTGDATYTAVYTETVNKYTIKFVNYDGTLLQTENLEYGVMPEYKGSTPTKKATEDNKYVFVGWDKPIVSVVGEETYTATFREDNQTYTLTGWNWTGDYENGYSKATATFVAAEGGFTANIEATLNDKTTTAATCTNDGVKTYTAIATFKGTQYTESKTAKIPATGHAWGEPTYTWSDDNSTVTAASVCANDASHVETETVETVGAVKTAATCTEVGTTTYTATFENEAFATQTKDVADIPALGHDLIHHDAKAATCTEIGWDEYDTCSRCDYTTYKEIAALGHDYVAVVTAPTCTEKGYTTYTCSRCGDSYVDDEVAALGHDLVHHEAKAPTCTEIGWNEYDTCSRCDYTTYEEIAALGHDLIHHESKAPTCTEIGWNEYDTCSRCDYTTYKELPALGHDWDAPVWHWSDNYTSATATFVCKRVHSHEQTIDAVVSKDDSAPDKTKYTATVTFEDVTYTDVQTESKYYTITFVNYDGTELQSSEVEYGTIPVYGGETPTKQADAQYTYTFAGWDPAIHEVSGTETYTATFTEATNTYTVTWNNYDGSELETDEGVTYGEKPSYDGVTPVKLATDEFSYTFAGWSPTITADTIVTGNITYTATFTETRRSYTITFVNENGNVLQSSDVEYGTVPAYTGETPTKDATAQYTYTFAGWDSTPVAVTGEATYKATYTATVNTYTVTWKNEDGTVLETDENVEYGTTPEYNGATPTKGAGAGESYQFTGWDSEVTAVTGDVTYTAQFKLRNCLHIHRDRGDSLTEQEQDFLYVIKGTSEGNSNVNTQVVLRKGEKDVYVVGLPDGEYEVTEVATWSWRITPNLRTQNVTFGGETNRVTVTFGTSSALTKWLNAFASVVNVITGTNG